MKIIHEIDAQICLLSYLLSAGKHRDIDVRITPSESILISTDVNCLPLSRSAAASVKPPPTKLTLIRVVEMSNWCTTVSTYQGCTYVELDTREISRIGPDSKVKSFAKLNNTIYGMAINEGLLYTTSGHSPQVVSVHNLNTGKLVRSWNHSETVRRYSSNLAVVGDDKVVIADRCNKRLSVYTLAGQIIRQIPCQQLNSGHYVSMCAADNYSVILTVNVSNRVYRISITTGQVLWEFFHVQKPSGVTCYNNQYVLVVSGGQQVKIQILDINTG